MTAAIWSATRSHRAAEEQIRRTRPLIRLWNGEWDLQHVVRDEYSAQFSFVSNDTGPGRLELPFDSPAAQWIHDQAGRIERGEGRVVGITVDYCGARWSGLLDKHAVEQRADGEVALVCDWMHDYEHLKFTQIWSNPWFPALFQMPRAWTLAGPVTWIAKLTLLANIARRHNPLITWPDDPLDPQEWISGFMSALDVSQWPVVVKPTSFIDAAGSGVVWGVLIARWKTWHDAVQMMLEDAELSVRADRWLPGDDEPWEGANLRPGTLVIDIVDKSGVFIGTSHGGTVFDGLVRTVAEFTDDLVESTLTTATDSPTPTDYWRIGYRYTDKSQPYVVFQEGDNSPIETAGFINSPAKCVQINAGGHSMPGVNEAISASIQASFDILGALAQIGSLGGTVDTLLRPLYEDTVLAWHSQKLHLRAQTQGWAGLFEHFQEGADRAYTIAALMVIRAGAWATKTTVSWKVNVADARPFMVGDRGIGHLFLDDRVGLRLKGSPEIHMDRCRKLDLAWDADNPPEWTLNIGDDRVFQDPAQRAWGKIERLVAGMRDLGVY